MKKYLLPIILLLALFLRLYGIDWDAGFHLHPDERMLIMVAERLRFPDALNPDFFAYGSFPIYLLKFISWVVGLDSYSGMLYIGRAISALFDTGTVLLVYFIAKQIKPKTAYLAAFFYSISVLSIQSAHFFISDIPLTFFTTLTLYLLLKLISRTRSSIRLAIGLGAAIGLALATKIPAVFLAFPVLAVIILRRVRFKQVLVIGMVSFIVFAVAMPYAILDFAEFRSQLVQQSLMRKDAFIFPYTLQYVGTRAYLYFIDNIVRWGLGWPLGILAIAGTTFAFLHIKAKPFIVIFAFAVPFLLFMGSSAVKFMRYMLPLYPLLAIFSALFISRVQPLLKLKVEPLLIVIVIWPLAFMSIYSRPHSRVAASEWMFSNIPAGSTLAVEHWDDRLPLPIKDSSIYNYIELPLYESDTPDKWQSINEKLVNTDYIIMASNRLYTPLMKLTDCENLPPDRCYPQTAQYYQDLFAEKLGFELVADFVSYPRFSIFNFQFSIPDQTSDESFTVYDHPRVMIYEKNIE